jgi:hypothetical protein
LPKSLLVVIASEAISFFYETLEIALLIRQLANPLAMNLP